jgi:hypothetical protein
MEIVNGFVCMNCCDVDKARLGQDPHQSTDQMQKQIDRHLDNLAPSGFGPAVTFGGTLQETTTGASGDATATAGPPQSSQTGSAGAASTAVNLLV